jgi:hypothetical protein
MHASSVLVLPRLPLYWSENRIHDIILLIRFLHIFGNEMDSLMEMTLVPCFLWTTLVVPLSVSWSLRCKVWLAFYHIYDQKKLTVEMEGLAGGWQANVRLLVALNNLLTDEDESMFNFTSLPVCHQLFRLWSVGVDGFYFSWFYIELSHVTVYFLLTLCLFVCATGDWRESSVSRASLYSKASYHYYQPSLWIDPCGMLLSV